ncbi:Uncharacterized conserved protein YhbP, UPF0306 family [Pedococcus dokdonensis]|uniref:Uncharacterized conserved protein YhbP, UPF0306 family n=1 Tax=Pedococcus dokdonensis TaxID=443156 RepID=A0A1H0MGJ6_9MICO|nr:pyridoxamine 5'-phosphate oxidase family protein [Pedococcus dokdonensis]SDO79260.1 Uncharacterized conserved protein YhbP, UPF0306 family [Pedococcus dokdonensis]
MTDDRSRSIGGARDAGSDAADRMPAARALAEGILEDLRYVVLATSDASGAPWASPVYFAHRGLEELFWVSRPTSTHSVNVTQRPDVGLVVFDSRIAVGEGRGVYARALVDVPEGDERVAALDAYSRRSEVDGAGVWTTERLRDNRFGLYRARTTEVSVLTGDGPDIRLVLPS